VVFELLAIWRKQPLFATVAYYNLLCAAISIPFTIATGVAAWQWQLEGAALKGNLRIHLGFATATSAIILFLFWRRYSLRKNDHPPRAGYFTLTAIGLVMITATGHLGGILSGVEAP
jgi:uncharacterized membrane protein